jgi:hypothetical protein
VEKGGEGLPAATAAVAAVAMAAKFMEFLGRQKRRRGKAAAPHDVEEARCAIKNDCDGPSRPFPSTARGGRGRGGRLHRRRRRSTGPTTSALIESECGHRHDKDQHGTGRCRTATDDNGRIRWAVATSTTRAKTGGGGMPTTSSPREETPVMKQQR